MRILFATDGSEDAGAALQVLNRLPLPAETRIDIVYVLSEAVTLAGPYADGFAASWTALEKLRASERELAEQAVEQAAERLRAPGREVTTQLRDGDAAREIVAAAKETSADLVVVGSRGLTGLNRFLIGSVAGKVARYCPAPTLIGNALRNDLRDIIVATDGSDHARRAVELAAGLPVPEETRFTVVHVIRPYNPFPGLFPTDREEFESAVLEVQRKREELGHAVTADAARILRDAGRRVESELSEGDPAEQILVLADEKKADLIVAGARGVGLLQELMIGSVAERLARDAKCSLLLGR